MLFYCYFTVIFIINIGEEEVKNWQIFVYYFMDGLLQTLFHIRIRLMKSSFDLLLCKTL